MLNEVKKSLPVDLAVCAAALQILNQQKKVKIKLKKKI